jgi:hypothetical protein
VWLYPPAAAGAGSRPLGAQENVNIADEGVTVSVPPPAAADGPFAPSRLTGNPANALGVRVSLVVRSSEPDISLSNDSDRTVPAAGNRPAYLGLANFRRATVETTVLLRNLQSRLFIYPIVDATGVIEGANRGGG